MSEEEEREQMMFGLACETEEGEGSRTINREPSQRWPHGVVPYLLSCSFDADDRGVIAVALDHIKQKSCVEFRYANVEDEDWVTINNTETGCKVKRTGYLQIVFHSHLDR